MRLSRVSLGGCWIGYVFKVIILGRLEPSHTAPAVTHDRKLHRSQAWGMGCVQQGLSSKLADKCLADEARLRHQCQQQGDPSQRFATGYVVSA